MYKVTKDGEVRASGLTENEAFVWLLKHQGQSVAFAIEHGGWDIVPETPRFAVVTDANRRDNMLAVIHADGCPAVSKDENRGSHTWHVAGSLRDAMDVAVDPDDRELGYGDEDVKVHECAQARGGVMI